MREVNVDAARAGSRPPITLEEIPYLERMGHELHDLRRRHDVRVVDLVHFASMDKTTLWRIERGLRRTRRSTLERLVNGIDHLRDEDRGEFDPGESLDRLVELAGPALSPESPHQDRIIRRAIKREARRVAQRTPWEWPDANE